MLAATVSGRLDGNCLYRALDKPTGRRLDWERYRTSGETCASLVASSVQPLQRGKERWQQMPPFGGADKHDPNVISTAMQFAEIRQQMQRVELS